MIINSKVVSFNILQEIQKLQNEIGLADKLLAELQANTFYATVIRW